MNNRFFVSLAVIALSLTTVLPSLAAGEVVIINTGDRLTPGYQVTVEPNGRILGALTPRHGQKTIQRTDQLIPAVRRRFFANLASAEPLEALPVGVGASTGGTGRSGRRQRGTTSTRSVSGARLFVRYGGRQSPNLREAGSPAGKTLLQDVKQIIGLLRFPVPERS